MRNIAITMREDFLVDRSETRYSVDIRLLSFVQAIGFNPILIHNHIRNKFDLENILKNSDIHGCILSGGNDLGKCAKRDQTETWLIEFMLQNSFPILGICRGMLMIGNYFGVESVAIQGHVAKDHIIKNRSSQKRKVNSYHNWILPTCPANFKVTEISEDGSIEAIQHNYQPVEGWMWHPERTTCFDQVDLLNATNLFKGAK